MKKKIVLVLAAAAVVLVAATVLLILVVDADNFREFIETRAETTLGRDVRLGRLGLSLVPVFGIQVDDVAVAARPDEGEGDLLSLRSLRIGARLMPLLAKRLEVTSIVLVEPSVNLVRDAEGDWNFDLESGGAAPESERSAEPDSARELTIDSLRITGGRLSVRDATRSSAQPLEVALTDLDLELLGFGSGEFRVSVDSGQLAVSDPSLGSGPLDLELGKIDLAVRGRGDEVELTNIELVVGSTTVALTGSVQAQPEGRRIDIDLQPTSIGADDISSLIATAAGDLGLGAQARLSGITIDAATLTHPVTDIDAVATLRGTTVSVDGLRARLGDSDLAGTLQLAIQDRPTLDFALESQRADLGELLGLIAGEEDGGTDQDAPPDPDSFLLKGIADGSLTVAEGSWTKLRFRDLEARLRLENGIATLEPVSMELYDGRFSGRLKSDLTRVPQSFEFSGEADRIDMDPFIADQMGMSDILLGRFTGRVAGQGAGSDPVAMIRSLEGDGAARIVDGQVGRLDVLRSVGQVAGVLGQRTLANLASESATGATKFSQLGGDFRVGGGTLSFDSVLLQSTAFDLTGTGTVNLLSSVMNGIFQIQFRASTGRPQSRAWPTERSNASSPACSATCSVAPAMTRRKKAPQAHPATGARHLRRSRSPAARPGHGRPRLPPGASLSRSPGQSGVAPSSHRTSKSSSR
jgi:AsmA protein